MVSMPVLRPGQVCKEVVLKDGRKAVLRVPRWDDLDEFLALINELVDEHADILRSTRSTRDEETEWLADRLSAIEKGNLIALIAEVNGRVVGSSDVARRTPENPQHNHVGVLGIAILKRARGLGLGKMLMDSLIQLSKQAGLKIIILDMFETNKVARRLYERVGFVEVGKIPKAINQHGKYIDLIRFAIEI
jgi:RimJ/RimL family protein N-acetyltransferase